MYSFNYLKELIGPLNLRGIEKIMKKDASTFKCDEATYLKENYVAYLTCSSTWLALYPTRPLIVRMFNLLENYGLIPMISYAKDADVALLKGQDIDSSNPFAEIVPLTVRAYMRMNGDVSKITIPTLSQDPRLFKKIHQVLVYATRFSAPYMPFLDESTYTKFKNEQKRLLQHDRTKQQQKESPRINGSYVYWGTRVRNKIAEALPWDKICAKVKALIENPRILLSPGSCYMTGSAVGKKIMYLAGKHPELFMPIHGYSATLACKETPSVEGRAQGHIVPKSSSIKRFIAAEEVYRQLICLGVFSILDDYLANLGIDLHNQEEQRSRCKIAASTKEYATTDVSSASDGITTVLFEDLFPPEFCELVRPYLPTSVQVTVSKKEYVIDLASRMTMGNAITFPCECLVFWAADMACIEAYELFTQSKLTKYEVDYENGSWLKIPGIYGDDQIHHSVVSETVYECLSALGFIVNTDKSYSGIDEFREACGVEYLRDWDVTPVRYPRKTVHGTVTLNGISLSSNATRDSRTNENYDSTMTLISLQKQLIEADLLEAAEIVTAIVCVAKPNMTFSSIGSDCTDLWGNVIKTRDLGQRQYVMLSPYYVNRKGKPQYLAVNEITRTLDAIMAKYERQFGKKPTQIDIDEKDYPNLFCELTKNGVDVGEHTHTVTYHQRIELDGNVRYVPHQSVTKLSVISVMVKRPISATYATVPYEFDMHLTPETEYVLSKEDISAHRSDIVENAVLEQWLYTLYLQNGPSYEHAPDTFEGVFERLWGITKPLIPGHNKTNQDIFYERLFGRPCITWKEKADR